MAVTKQGHSGETWQIYGIDGELLAEYKANAAAFLPAKEYGYRGGELLVTMSSGDDNRLSRFVTNLYYGALQRDPTSTELQNGINQLAAAGTGGYSQLLSSASQLARALFTSTNYENNTGRTDLQYTTDLYYAYVQRGPDDGGLGWWVGQIPGSGRANVCNAFEASSEFQTLVSTLYGSASSDNQRTEDFVTKAYRGALGRDPNATELQTNRDALNAAAAQGVAAVQAQAETFVRSLVAAQVNDYSISDQQFVTNLYEAFLQRGPDAGGLGFWTSVAGGGNRPSVLNAFATCSGARELAGTLYREAFWLVADHLGTPRMIVDKSGSLASVRRHDYLPFGEEVFAGTGGRTTAQGYSAGDGVRQHFTGEERDNETGLDYFINRYHSSSQGRFTSVDPIKLTPERLYQPQRFNLYSYTINNPLTLIDPDGKDIDFINKTKEGRRKALLSITANMTASEARNVGVKWNKDTKKYEGYVKDASKIDLSKASQGYQDFSNRVNDHDLKLNYAFIGKGDSVTIEMNGVQTKITQKTLIQGGDSSAFLAPQSDGSYTAVVAEGGSGRGVLALTPSGREVPVVMPDFIATAHELFAESYKYTAEGRRQGLDREENIVDDSNKVIEIENKYRDFHGLPHRSGTDHGYIHAPTVTVRP